MRIRIENGHFLNIGSRPQTMNIIVRDVQPAEVRELQALEHVLDCVAIETMAECTTFTYDQANGVRSHGVSFGSNEAPTPGVMSCENPRRLLDVLSTIARDPGAIREACRVEGSRIVVRGSVELDVDHAAVRRLKAQYEAEQLIGDEEVGRRSGERAEAAARANLFTERDRELSGLRAVHAERSRQKFERDHAALGAEINEARSGTTRAEYQSRHDLRALEAQERHGLEMRRAGREAQLRLAREALVGDESRGRAHLEEQEGAERGAMGRASAARRDAIKRTVDEHHTSTRFGLTSTESSARTTAEREETEARGHLADRFTAESRAARRGRVADDVDAAREARRRREEADWRAAHEVDSAIINYFNLSTVPGPS